MDLRLDRAASVPLVEQLQAQLRLLVRRGELEPGERLPTIKALATELGVNPNTVAAAYRALEAEGVVRTNRRAGTAVADRPRPAPAAEALAARIGAELGRRLAELELPLAEALPALAAAAQRPGDEPLRVAVLGRSPLAAETAARRAAVVLGDGWRCVPLTPERYRSFDYHLCLIDPDLVPTLIARADVLPEPALEPRWGPDHPAGAD